MTAQPLCYTPHSFISALPSDKQLSPFQLSQLLATLEEPQISLSAYLSLPFAMLQPVLSGSPDRYSHCCPPCPKDNWSRSASWSAVFLSSVGPVPTQLSCGSLPSNGQLSRCHLPCVASPLSSVLVRGSCAAAWDSGDEGLPGAWQGVVQVRAGRGLPGHSTLHPEGSPITLAVTAPRSASVVRTQPSARHPATAWHIFT